MGSERPKKALTRGKVLPFEQSGEFFFKRGLSKLDSNNLIDALAYYRLALERDPENKEIRLAMAEVLTEMSRFEESNRILLLMLSDGWFRTNPGDGPKDLPSECFFGMGCNFMGLNDYAHAKDSLERYVESDPEGEFAYDAFDMLDALDEAELYENGEVLVPVSREDDALDLTDEGRAQLEKEQYADAVDTFKRAVALSPNLNAARNGLALAYFCRHDVKSAIAEVEKVIESDGANIQARCNLAMFLHSIRDDERANSIADGLCDIDNGSSEDINRASLVLMELGRFKEAQKPLSKLLGYTPYDPGVLHRAATCAYETGDYLRATSYYDKLLRMDHGDSVARYYRGLCRAASAGAGKRRKFMTDYQVPFDEMIARINRLNEFVSMPREKLDKLWREDDGLVNLIRWGFTLPDASVKRAMLMLVGSFSDARAERLLRDFALRQDQPDDLKQEAFSLLAQQGAKSPYLGYIDGELIESRVSVTGNLLGRMPKAYREIMELCFSSMHGERSEKCLLAAFKLWLDYIALLGEDFPRLTHQQVYALAAALEYSSCHAAGEKAARAEICAKYGVSAMRFKNAMAKLSRVKR